MRSGAAGEYMVRLYLLRGGRDFSAVLETGGGNGRMILFRCSGLRGHPGRPSRDSNGMHYDWTLASRCA